MKSVVAGLLAALAFALPAAALDWHGGMNPNSIVGSFKQSCNSCSVDGNGYLVCSCENNDGMHIQTAVRLSYCGSGVDNINGALQCYPKQLGSWTRTCTSATVQSNKLYYTCQVTGRALSRNGIVVIDDCPGMNYENVQGRLRCRP
jgi:CVNH domain-containing protein